MSRVFFLDFDGTVTKEDVVASMVVKFSRNDGWKELNRRWQRGELSTKDCAEQTFALFDATLDDLYPFLNTIELDDYFVDFVALCKANNYPLYIISDGYRLLIDYILQRHGLTDLPVFANKMLCEADRFSIECTHFNPRCGKCGTCKKVLYKRLKKQGHQNIYVGDSYSDMCVCHYADVVFAKDALLKYCRQNKVPAIPYTTFKDLIDWVNKESF